MAKNQKTYLQIRAEAQREKRRREGKYNPVHSLIDWKPLKGPQENALESGADELLYGGAAGGGKTDLLLGTAIREHKSSIIFRRELAQMKGAEGIISRSENIVGDAGKLNRTDWVWRDLPGEASLEFAGVPHEHSKNRYKGRPHDFKGFDELTEFSRSQYRFLIIWNRTSVIGQRCRVVATTNPPITEDESWVIDEWAPWLDPEFPEPAEPGELRYYSYDGDDLIWITEDQIIWKDGAATAIVNDEERELKSRTFIPAKLEDNPYLMETGYSKILDALPEELRESFKSGEFNRDLDANPLQVIPTSWVKLAQERWKTLKAEGFEPGVPMTAIGVDPSRGGKDSTVLIPRYADYVPEVIEIPGKKVPDGPTGAAHILKHHSDDAKVVIDVIGIGSSVYDSAKDMLPCAAFNASGKSRRTDKSKKFKFVNKRAEAYWLLREMLDPSSEYEIALPDSNKLRQELCAPKFKVVKSGIQIEDKDDIKKRIGRSPDIADAITYAFAKDMSTQSVKGASFKMNF